MMALSGASGSGELTLIQVLRALAAISVAFFHLEIIYRAVGAPLPFSLVWAAGVDVFFVISGFIMVYSSERLFGRPGAGRYFLLRRIARIVPLYWTTTGVLAFLALTRWSSLAEGNVSVWTLVTSFLFIPWPRPDGLLQPLHNLGWTLNYEMLFYAIFAAALAGSRTVTVCAVTLTLAILVVTGLALKPLPPMLAFWTDGIMLEFVFGMMLALAWRAGWRLPLAAGMALVVLGLAGFAASAAWGPLRLHRVIEWGIPAALIVAGAVLVRVNPKGVVWKLMEVLGDASYSIYLVHLLVYIPLRHRVAALVDPATMPVAYGAVLLTIAIVVAVIVYYAFERPVTRFLQRRIVLRAAPS